MLRLDTLRDTPIERNPFEHVIVKDFIEREELKKVLADYPEDCGGFQRFDGRDARHPLSECGRGKVRCRSDG